MASIDFVVITAPTQRCAEVYSTFCNHLKQKLSQMKYETAIYCVADPPQQVGSGGCIFNALDYLKEKHGVDEIMKSRAAVIHHGGDSRRVSLHSISGKAWASLNTVEESKLIATPMALLITELCLFGVNLPKGSMIVASSDVLLDICHAKGAPRVAQDAVSIVTVPETLEMAKGYGVAVKNMTVWEDKDKGYSMGVSSSYLHRPSVDEMEMHGAVFEHSTLGKCTQSHTGLAVFTGTALSGMLALLDDPIVSMCTFRGLSASSYGKSNDERSSSNGTQHTEHLQLDLESDLLHSFALESGPSTFDEFYDKTQTDSSNGKSCRESTVEETRKMPQNYVTAMKSIHEKFKMIPLVTLTIRHGLCSHLAVPKDLLDLVTYTTERKQRNRAASDFGTMMSPLSDKITETFLPISEGISGTFSYMYNATGAQAMASLLTGEGLSNDHDAKISRMYEKYGLTSRNDNLEIAEVVNNEMVGQSSDDSVLVPMDAVLRRDHANINSILIKSDIGADGGAKEMPCVRGVIEHSCLSGAYEVGNRAIVSHILPAMGEDLVVLDDMIMQQIPLHDPSTSHQINYNCGSGGDSVGLDSCSVFTLVGLNDDVTAVSEGGSATICGVSWSTFFDLVSLDAEAIWPSLPPSERTLWNAKIFPCFRRADLSCKPITNELYLFWMQFMCLPKDERPVNFHEAIEYWCMIPAWGGAFSTSSNQGARNSHDFDQKYRFSLADLLQYGDAYAMYVYRAYIHTVCSSSSRTSPTPSTTTPSTTSGGLRGYDIESLTKVAKGVSKVGFIRGVLTRVHTCVHTTICEIIKCVKQLHQIHKQEPLQGQHDFISIAASAVLVSWCALLCIPVGCLNSQLSAEVVNADCEAYLHPYVLCILHQLEVTKEEHDADSVTITDMITSMCFTLWRDIVHTKDTTSQYRELLTIRYLRSLAGEAAVPFIAHSFMDCCHSLSMLDFFQSLHADEPGEHTLGHINPASHPRIMIISAWLMSSRSAEDTEPLKECLGAIDRILRKCHSALEASDNSVEKYSEIVRNAGLGVIQRVCLWLQLENSFEGFQPLKEDEASSPVGKKGSMSARTMLEKIAQKITDFHVLSSLSMYKKMAPRKATYGGSGDYEDDIISIHTPVPGDEETDVGLIGAAMLEENSPVVVCKAGARIDLAGGWSDTPPMCYETAGAVFNVAVLVDGQKPITCAARYIPKPMVLLKTYRPNSSTLFKLVGSGLGDAKYEADILECVCIADFANISSSSPCALLQAVIVALGIAPQHIESTDDKQETKSDLPDILCDAFDGKGVELACYSSLPPGSGMGGSSIIAATALKALSTLIGRQTTPDVILQQVNHVEQILDTGGGWQDQVGALFGGFKVAKTAPSLPLTVNVEVFPSHDVFNKVFGERTWLIYTGKHHADKTTLVKALRKCALCPQLLPSTIAGVDESSNKYGSSSVIAALVQGTDDATRAVRKLSTLKYAPEVVATSYAHNIVDELADILSSYWDIKKIVTDEVEPDDVADLLEHLRDICSGISFCGPGVGGYACVILKRDVPSSELVGLVNRLSHDNSDIRLHRVAVDPKGIAESVHLVRNARDNVGISEYF